MTKARLTLFLLLLLGAAARTAAYTDHRGHKTDSLEAVFGSRRALTDEERMDAYKSLMWGYLNTNSERAIRYARQALALSYGHDWQNSRADALRILGLVAYGSTNYDTALGYFQQALAVTDSMQGNSRYKESDIDDNYSALYGSIANLYNMRDEAHLAIAYYQKALPIFEKYRWTESTSILYHNVGELYQGMGNYGEARRNFILALENGRRAADSLLVAMSCKGLAKACLSLGHYAQAEQAAREAYAYYRHHTTEENEDYLTTLCDLARVELKGNASLQRADAYCREALAALTDETGADERADVYNLCAELALEHRHWQEAKDYALKALATDTLETIDDQGSRVLLATACAELGETAQVRQLIAAIYNGMEQLATDHYQSGLSQMQVLYETEQRRAEAEQRQQENEQLRHEKRWVLWGGVLTALVLLLTAVTFFLLWRSIRLQRRSALMQARIDGEVGERIRLSRDLHDRLGGLLTALRQQLAAAAPATNGESASQALALTDDAISEMRNVAHHLLPDSLKRHGLRTALRDYCATMKNVSFSFLGKEQHVDHEEAIYCIVYELVNNAVKNAGAQHISVQLIADEALTAISVGDDGCGMAWPTTGEPPAQQEGHGDGGNGLRNISERVEAIGGTMSVTSRPGEGTEVNIELPRRH